MVLTKKEIREMEDYRDIKILVVDDMVSMQSLIAEVLRRMGFVKIAMAKDGADGLKKAKQLNFDLIISDWDMPTMDGLELLKAIRAESSISQTPFLMLTANANKDKVMQAVRAKVNDYIAKPFQPVSLSEKINRLLRHKLQQVAEV